jgi:CubicO group peptidase (beta-lactamase class C family)
MIEGHCDSAFRLVADAFEANLSERLDVGAGVCVHIEGKEVVNLWGGHMDAARSKPWRENTLVLVASTSKALTATCLLQLIEQGRVRLDEPVCTYWPEFARAGKEEVTIEHIMSHRAGVPAVSTPLPPDALTDWELMVHSLEEQRPFWPPGTKHGYHSLTFGFLLGEVIRRVSGQRVGAYLKEHVCAPLGLDFYIGLPASEDARTADVIPADLKDANATPLFAEVMRRAAIAGSVTQLTMSNPATPPDAVNSRALRAAEIPAGNGHGTARALAQFYSTLARGAAPLLREETLHDATRERVFGIDEVLGIRSRFGLGFMLRHELFPIGPDARAFGHPGAGGNLAFADPTIALGFGYVMNRGKPSAFGSPTAYRLVDALYGALDARR